MLCDTGWATCLAADGIDCKTGAESASSFANSLGQESQILLFTNCGEEDLQRGTRGQPFLKLR